MKKLTLLFLGLMLLMGCQTAQKSTPEETIYVTIAPLKGMVEKIVGPDYPIEVLVPAGSSPESYEPTARQIADLKRAPLILTIGWLDFEKNLLRDFEGSDRVVKLCRGIRPIVGSCSHHTSQGRHRHIGYDPHIWTSPRELQKISERTFKAIQKLHPDSTHYMIGYLKLRARITALDQLAEQQIAQSGVKSFLIYHPAFTYYARAYGIEQVAIEHEGKEPSARRLSEIIEAGRAEGVRHIFYQSQYPASTVETIASDLGAEAVAVNPLNEDIISEILRFTNLLCGTGNYPN